MSALLDKDFTYAIVGASNNPDKYGYKVLYKLNALGYNVVPINPHEEEIIGLDAFPTLSAVPVRVDVVVFVVPPSVTELILESVVNLGIKRVWMQPGSESENAIAFCETHGLVYVARQCIMLQ